MEKHDKPWEQFEEDDDEMEMYGDNPMDEASNNQTSNDHSTQNRRNIFFFTFANLMSNLYREQYLIDLGGIVIRCSKRLANFLNNNVKSKSFKIGNNTIIQLVDEE